LARLDRHLGAVTVPHMVHALTNPVSASRQVAAFCPSRPPRLGRLYSREATGYRRLPLGLHVPYPPHNWRRSRLPSR
jgi:hypothetical protein